MSGRRVALLWAGDPSAPAPSLESTRLAAIGRALAAVDLEPIGVVYADEIAPTVEARLSTADAVLVWVNPIVERGGDRTVLNAMLRRLADGGIYVSAHPDVIDAIGTKEVVYRTRDMAWGSDVRMYASAEDFRRRFPACLAEGMPRVLKQVRGNGGNGVWKVSLDDSTRADASSFVTVRHAARGSAEERLTLGTCLDRYVSYFEDGSRLIDQVYQPRLTDGMVRCYLAGDRVVGFGEQKINALYPAASTNEAPPQPGPRLYFPATRDDLQTLKTTLENQWLAQLCDRCSTPPAALPAIWDADFLYGPKSAAGDDTYVLCEINVSSVFPIPDSALAPLAELVANRLPQAR